MKFLVQMDLGELEKYLAMRLRELEEWLSEERWAGRDAVYYRRRGESQAIRDILSLIGLYGANFLEKIQEVQQRRISWRKPSYDETLDLQNDDAHWVSGYDRIVSSIKKAAAERKQLLGEMSNGEHL